MSEAVKVARAEVVALFEALDFAMAHKWDNKRLTKKCKSIGEIADDSVELPDNIEATLIAIQEAVENGQAIEVVDEDATEDTSDAEPEVDDTMEAVEEVAEPATEEASKEEAPKKKKRGRPAGSKNVKGKTKAKVEAPKESKTKVEKAAKQSRPKVLDRYSAGPFVRWLGRLGIGFDGAKIVVEGEGCLLSDISIRSELKEKREKCPSAKVTAEDKDDLQAKYPAVFEKAE